MEPDHNHRVMGGTIVEVRGIPIHHEEFGDGRPVIVLHGFGLEHRNVTRVYEPIFADRSGWRRIYPDMPGHGRTPAPDWLDTEDQMLEVLTEFVDAVAADQALVLVGQSWGAYLVHGLACQGPNRVDGLTMTVPVVHADRDRRDVPQPTVIVSNPDVLADLGPEDLELFLQVSTVQTAEMVRRFQEMSGLLPPDEPFQERLLPNYAFSFEDELTATIEAPALVVAGRQDAVTGYRDHWSWLDHLPRATFAVLDRAGHGLEDEQQDLLRVLAGEWLDRVEEYAAQRSAER